MTGADLLFLLAAICGLVAAGFWLRVSLSLGSGPDGNLRGNRQAFGNAAMATALALVLASLGVLLPVLLA